MADYDLTAQLVANLDRHLSYPLLEYLAGQELYPAEDILRAQYDLMKAERTHDFLEDTWRKLHQSADLPAELTERRKETAELEGRLHAQAARILEVIENPEVGQNLRQDKLHNLQYLKDNFNITSDEILPLHALAKYQYSVGDYPSAADSLYHLRILTTDPELANSATWGKLAAESLSGNWDAALEEVETLRETLEQRSSLSPLSQLQQRTHLVHYSLFVFFNHPLGRQRLIDLFISPAYLNTIQTNCPWILRYLCIAMITTKRKTKRHDSNIWSGGNDLSDLVRIVQQEDNTHDPVLRFVIRLLGEFDFSAAQKELANVKEAIENDFFLAEFVDDFLEHARYQIAEVYCKIHRRIDIKDLSARLGLPVDEGEKWIVHLIRDTRTDAKVDLQKGVVYMQPYQPSIHQQVIDRTRGLVMRSSLLANAMDRRAHGNAPLDRDRYEDRKGQTANARVFKDLEGASEAQTALTSTVEVS